MDKMQNSIQEIQGYQKDIRKIHDDVQAQEPNDIDFNDISFDVRNSGRMKSRFGRNTAQEVADGILKVISSGKDAPEKQQDVEKYLKDLQSSLEKNVERIQGIQKEMDQLYDGKVEDKLARYVEDTNTYKQRILDLYHRVDEKGAKSDDLDDIVSEVLQLGKKYNKVTQNASQSAITDIIQLVKSHDEHIVATYLMDYFLMMAGKIGFDANDKAELSYGMDQ